MIFFCIVLYGKAFDESTTMRSLAKNLYGIARYDYEVVVVDNSAGVEDFRQIDDRVALKSFRENVGLAKAYNYAFNLAKEKRASHLVTLDQDSVVSSDYIESLYAAIGRNLEISALCPLITSAQRIVSPFDFDRKGLPTYGDTKSDRLYAINSFATYSLKLLEKLGGFEEYYWLDGLDLATSARVHVAGANFFVLDVTVAHELSMLSEGMGRARFLNICRYESSFVFQYCRPIHRLLALARVIWRVFRLKRYGLTFNTVIPALASVFDGVRTGWKRRSIPDLARIST